MKNTLEFRLTLTLQRDISSLLYHGQFLKEKIKKYKIVLNWEY